MNRAAWLAGLLGGALAAPLASQAPAPRAPARPPARRPAPTAPAPLAGGPTTARPPLVAAVAGDTVVLLLPESARPGYAWRVTRDGTPVGDPLVAPVTDPDSIVALLGPDLAMARRLTDADDPLAVGRRLQLDPVARVLGPLLSRRMGRVAGRLVLDGTARPGATVRYRAALVPVSGGEPVRAHELAVRVAPVPVPAVTALEAETVTDGVRLRWRFPRYAGDPRDAVVAFVVERMTGTGPWEGPARASVLRSDAGTSAWVDAEAAELATYRYRVRPVLLGGMLAGEGAAVGVTVADRTRPTAIRDVAVEAGEDGVRVVWRLAPEPDVTGYHVERAAGAESTYVRLTRAAVAADQPEWRDTLARPGAIHAYRVRAVDRAGNLGEPSNAVTLRVADRDPPAAPGSLTLTVLKERRARYRWRPSPSPELLGYHVFRAEPGQAPTRLTRVPIAAAELADSGFGAEGLMPGRTYEVRVVAVDSSLNESPAVSARLTLPDDAPPEAPRAVTARNVLGRHVEVTWTASPALDVQGYVVQRLEAGQSAPVALARVGAGGPFVAQDTAAPRGQRATYVVIPLDSAGNRGVAASDTVTFRDLTHPASPRVTRAVRGADGVAVTWEAVGSRDLQGYVVYRLDPGAPRRTRLTERPVTALRFVDRGAPGGARYVVRAVDRSGNESDDGPLSEAVGR